MKYDNIVTVNPTVSMYARNNNVKSQTCSQAPYNRYVLSARRKADGNKRRILHRENDNSVKRYFPGD